MANLGPTATEEKFRAPYRAILTTWFPTSKGYMIDRQVLHDDEVGRHNYLVVRHAGGYHNPLLIVKLKRPAKWNDAGKAEVLEDLTGYIRGRFDLTQYDTIYGLGVIGCHWMCSRWRRVVRMSRQLYWTGIATSAAMGHTVTSRL